VRESVEARSGTDKEVVETAETLGRGGTKWTGRDCHRN